jgi:O-antigen/teichoic acid export membrane protein
MYLSNKIADLNFKSEIKDLLLKASLATLIRVVGMAIGILLYVLVAKSLSVSDVGIFFLVISITTLVSILSTLGLSNAMVRFVSIFKENSNQVDQNSMFTLIMFIATSVSLVLSVLLYSISEETLNLIFSKPDFSAAIKNVVMIIPSMAAFTIITSAHQSVGNAAYGLFFQAIFHPLLFMILILFNRGDLIDVLYAYLNSLIITLVFSMFFLSKFSGIRLKMKFGKENIRLVKVLLRSYSIQGLVGLLIKQFPIVLASVFIPSAQVALLAISLKISSLVSFVLAATNLILQPKLAVMFNKGKLKDVEVVCQRVTFYMTLFSIPIVTLLLVFPDYILFLFDDRYIAAENILRVLVIGQFINVLTGSVGDVLIMSGKHDVLLKFQFLNLFVLLAVIAIASLAWQNVFMIALGVSLGVIIQNVGSYISMLKTLKISTIDFRFK